MLGKLRRKLHHQDDKQRRQTICEDINVYSNIHMSPEHVTTLKTVSPESLLIAFLSWRVIHTFFFLCDLTVEHDLGD